jgi:hypothetical protein
MKKKEAIEFAKSFDWTEADAKRAFIEIDLKEANEETLLLAMAKFAGFELLERQRSQAAQKAQVTKNRNYIKKIELEFTETVEAQEKEIAEMRSAFLPVIFKLYKFGQSFGLKDPWIEALMTTYEEYQEKSA